MKSKIAGLPSDAWDSPWLDVRAENDLVPAAARFASLVALGARAAAADRLIFPLHFSWLDAQTQDPDRTRAAVSALIDLAPELFGFYLVFWELIFRTHPHHD